VTIKFQANYDNWLFTCIFVEILHDSYYSSRLRVQGSILVPGLHLRPLQNVQFCSSSRKAKILTVRLSLPKTTGIYWIFRGLKFEPDLSECLPVRVRTCLPCRRHRQAQTGNAQAGAEIGQKGTLCKGLHLGCVFTGKASASCQA